MDHSVTGICGLCLQHRTLIKSHIFPKWAHQQVKTTPTGQVTPNWASYDEDQDTVNFEPMRKDDYEYLLCAPCDHGLGRYENNAASFVRAYSALWTQRKVIVAGTLPLSPTKLTRDRLLYPVYPGLKVALTGILFKAGLAQKNYKAVNLTDAEIIYLRNYLNGDNDGAHVDFLAAGKYFNLRDPGANNPMAAFGIQMLANDIAVLRLGGWKFGLRLDLSESPAASPVYSPTMETLQVSVQLVDMPLYTRLGFESVDEAFADYPIEDPCPCGSDRTYETCCKQTWWRDGLPDFTKVVIGDNLSEVGSMPDSGFAIPVSNPVVVRGTSL